MIRFTRFSITLALLIFTFDVQAKAAGLYPQVQCTLTTTSNDGAQMNQLDLVFEDTIALAETERFVGRANMIATATGENVSMSILDKELGMFLTSGLYPRDFIADERLDVSITYTSEDRTVFAAVICK